MDNMKIAKKANKLIKDVLDIIKDSDKATKADVANFENIPEIFNNACGMINGNKTNEALLCGWTVSMANNAVFLLFRRQLLTPEIEKAYRELPSTEDATKDYNDLLLEEKAVADDLEAKRREFMDKQHVLDIFKAVLNGEDKDKAEEKYQQYINQLAKSMGA